MAEVEGRSPDCTDGSGLRGSKRVSRNSAAVSGQGPRNQTQKSPLNPRTSGNSSKRFRESGWRRVCFALGSFSRTTFNSDRTSQNS
ncbi:hypothetical protein FQA47_000208 [Oryzias melastigma]|uniref:Uncharacterized protein n=1 Tax=Oryzias melastigma TaxID=30732 RepID=A0A834CEH3_ORYME|nr:hypothetical protein FQA47_000208 [Oryzias melastigma]